MKLYAGIDLHSNNSVVCVLDEQDREVVRRRLPNDLAVIRAVLEPHWEQLTGWPWSPRSTDIGWSRG
jgi:transposase